MNTFVPVPVPPSGFVTLTFLNPVAARAATVIFALRCVESVNVVLLTVMFGPKSLANPGPLTKLAPVIVTSPVLPLTI